MNRIILYPLVSAIVIFSIAVALLMNAIGGGGASDQHPLNKACYSLFSQSGHEYKSWFPPLSAQDAKGVYVFNNDHTWGYVFSPDAMVADRDCLRERYPGDNIVPALEGSDD